MTNRILIVMLATVKDLMSLCTLNLSDSKISPNFARLDRQFKSVLSNSEYPGVGCQNSESPGVTCQNSGSPGLCKHNNESPQNPWTFVPANCWTFVVLLCSVMDFRSYVLDFRCFDPSLVPFSKPIFLNPGGRIYTFDCISFLSFFPTYNADRVHASLSHK